MGTRLTDLFNNDKPQNTNPNPSVEDLLSGIKRDDGTPKYSSVEEALKALQESQKFIPQVLDEKKGVEAKLQELQEELTKRKTLEELTETLKSKPQPIGNDPTATPSDTPKGVNPEDIEKLLEEKLAQREAKSVQKSNYESVVAQLSSKFGDKAKEHIQKTAEQLGTTPEDLKKIASENPKLALRLLDNDGSLQTPNSNKSTINPPRTIEENNQMPEFEKGAVRGGLTDKEMAERWREVGSYTYKRLGVNTN